MAKKTGVLFIENYVAGGGDQVARALIQSLPLSRLTVMVNASNDMRILLAGKLPDHVEVDRYGLVTIAQLSSWANGIRNGLLRAVTRWVFFFWRYPLFIFSIFYFMRRLRRVNADIFVANNGGYPGGFYCRSATIAASLLSRTRVFHIVHGMAEPPRGPTIPFEWCIDQLIDRRTHLLTVSNATAVRLAQVRSIRQQAAVIYNGIPDLGAPPAPLTASPVFRILHVGYFDHNKNQRQLLKAVAQLVHQGISNLSVRFVGADTESGHLEQCRELAVELGIADKVQFSGFVEVMEVCYAETDLFVLCSLREGMPMSVLEAMRAGKPVVATDVGGIGEQVTEGENGFLVSVDHHHELADGIKALMLDLDKRTRFGRSSRTAYEAKFSTPNMVAAYVKALGL
jgi:glycosyltransferase involved in cell wall biosynthesis